MSWDKPPSNPYSPPGMGPGMGGPQAPIPGGTVKNYLVESILCLLCCFWPCAIPAIISASQVNTKLSQGDYQGAVEASENAKKWCLISMCVGLICVPIAVGLQVLIAIAENA